MKIKSKYYWCLLWLPLLFACSGPIANRSAEYQPPAEVTFELEGEILNLSEAEKALHVIEENLTYAEEKDLDGYLTTIISQAQEDTEAELSKFFDQYDLEHTILSAKVIDQTEDQLLIQLEQQTVVLAAVEGAETYLNHISEANHHLTKEFGEWKIQETIMTNTRFID